MPLIFRNDIDTLSADTKRLLYGYDCDCVPIFENQLGHFQAIEQLAKLWGIQPSPTSPATLPIGSPAANNPKPPCYAGKKRYKTKISYRFNQGQNVLEYGVNRALRTKFRYFSSFRDNFCDTNAECRECYSILRNVQNLNQHNTLEFRDSQSMRCSTEKTCQSNTTYRYIWGLNKTLRSETCPNSHHFYEPLYK